MKFSAAIIARMTSTRLPGKPLRKLAGKPMLEYILETLRQLSLCEIIVATSTDPTDQPLRRYCESKGIPFVCGSLHNVAHRFLDAIDFLASDAVFRVNGDSPLVSRHLFEQARSEFEATVPDLVTNVFPRSYPPGVSVELVSANSFRAAFRAFSEDDDREHVTRFFYKNSTTFRIVNIESSIDLSASSLAVDTPLDLRVIDRMVRAMKRPHWDYSVEELIALRESTIDEHIS